MHSAAYHVKHVWEPPPLWSSCSQQPNDSCAAFPHSASACVCVCVSVCVCVCVPVLILRLRLTSSEGLTVSSSRGRRRRRRRRRLALRGFVSQIQMANRAAPLSAAETAQLSHLCLIFTFLFRRSHLCLIFTFLFRESHLCLIFAFLFRLLCSYGF